MTSYVGAASAEATSVTLPSHQAGDTILIFGWNPSSTVPTIPSGFTSLLNSSGSGTVQGVWGWKIAESDSEVSGTWTNATLIAAIIFRDADYYVVPLARTLNSGASTATINYAAVTGSDANSWYVGTVGMGINNSNGEAAPSGMTNRTSVAGASAGEIAIHDTNGAASSWPSTNVTSVSPSVTYRSAVIELRKTTLAKSAGGGGAGDKPMLRQGQEGVMAL